MKNVKRLYNVLNNTLFRINEKPLSYKRIMQTFMRLVDEIEKCNDSDYLWSIGEFNECALDDLIIGAYWHFTEWHGGQDSLSYAVLCKLGEIFKPNMSCLDDGNFCYEQLEKIASLEL